MSFHSDFFQGSFDNNNPFQQSNLTKLPYNLPGEIYRGSMPNTKQLLPNWEKQLNENKIHTIVLLITKKESDIYLQLDLGKWYEDHNFEVVYFPIEDFSVPDDQSLDKALNQITELAKGGENIIVHCKGGIGRTGLVCSCLAKKIFQLEGDQAISWIRKVVPGAVETREQKLFINKFGETKADGNSKEAKDVKEASWASEFNIYTSLVKYAFNRSLNIHITSNKWKHPMDANKVTLGNNAFIAASSPYPDSFDRSSFWNMMLTNDSNICVSLSEGFRLDEEYTKIDGGVVKCLSEDVGVFGSVRREFEVRKLDEDGEILETKKFTQFDFPFWNRDDALDLESLEKFIKNIKECQEKTYGGKGAITVHSEAGEGRTGTFIASYQLMQEPKVNPLTLVDSMRIQRPGRKMVETPEQYILLQQLKEKQLENIHKK